MRPPRWLAYLRHTGHPDKGWGYGEEPAMPGWASEVKTPTQTRWWWPFGVRRSS